MSLLRRPAIERPLRIPGSRRFLLVNEIDTPMLVYSRLDYRELPEKRLPGTSTAFFYDPQLNLGRYPFMAGTFGC